MKVVIDIMPTLVGLLAAVVPVILVKLFSGSAATGLVLDAFRTYGPDSYIGMLVSILMSCTDTMLILRGSEAYLQRQDLEFVPVFLSSPVVLERQS